uniref:Uncharacterized protein n=1 Tax=Anguilla anguilla TaxID=7936 RepID=A0A0E9SM65_ANGAN
MGRKISVSAKLKNLFRETASILWYTVVDSIG